MTYPSECKKFNPDKMLECTTDAIYCWIADPSKDGAVIDEGVMCGFHREQYFNNGYRVLLVNPSA